MVVMEAAQSKRGMRKGSEGLKSIGRSLGFRVSRAVFPEDLKVSERKIFDPQDKFSLLWNKFFLISCILTVSVDPLFFYLPVINDQLHCLDAFYLIHMALQFCAAFVAPSSRVFGRGELVIDSAQIAKRYLLRYFIIDFMSVLPLPQIVGAFWYLLAIERNDSCSDNGYNENFLYCGNQYIEGYGAWQNKSEGILKSKCSADDDSLPFDYGIFKQALSSGIISSEKFVTKYCYCLWWGLQNLRLEWLASIIHFSTVVF